jgi:hypothetical protein
MVNGGWKLLSYDLSPFVNSFENMAIFLLFFLFSLLLFFLEIHVSNLFLNAWTFMCPYFFLDSPYLFCNNRWRERPTHIVELLFCGM